MLILNVGPPNTFYSTQKEARFLTQLLIISSEITKRDVHGLCDICDTLWGDESKEMWCAVRRWIQRDVMCCEMNPRRCDVLGDEFKEMCCAVRRWIQRHVMCCEEMIQSFEWFSFNYLTCSTSLSQKKKHYDCWFTREGAGISTENKVVKSCNIKRPRYVQRQRII